ncbi:MAG: exo-alpha-sialidase [Planctomycetota bacterium]|jgi:hypothetical protein
MRRQNSTIESAKRILLLMVALCFVVPAIGCSTAGPIKHVMVYKEVGRACHWPANYGTWSWGNEILVGFRLAYYKETERGYSQDPERPTEYVATRSLDGGKTWKLERPKGLDTDAEPIFCPGGINFTHPDFALRCRGPVFAVSYDRGKSWSVPYELPDAGRRGAMARTDYVVNGRDDCLMFLSALKTNILEGQPFCARTTDGGKTLDFVSWMTSEPRGFSIMPSTVRIAKNELVSAIRRMEDGLGFIEVYRSNDDGKSWELLSRPAETGTHNGNSADMVKLADGRLVLTYGCRSEPYGIRAKISTDNGKTWGEEIYLRDDGRTWDIGYPQTVLRPDGKLVTVYYFTTEENSEQHIAATIWDPERVE